MGAITALCCDERPIKNNEDTAKGSITPKLKKNKTIILQEQSLAYITPTKPFSQQKKQFHQNEENTTLMTSNNPEPIVAEAVHKESAKEVTQQKQQVRLKQTIGQNPSETKLRFRDFDIDGELGIGAFGTVYMVHLKKQKKKGLVRYYAMKRIEKTKISKKRLYESTKFQRYILANLENPFITSLKYSFQDAMYVYFIMECATGGNIYSLIFRGSARREHFARLGEIAVQFIAACVILAIQCLHENSIMYRDLKPENLLIFSDGYVKLTDFGLSKEVQSDDHLSKTEAGTALYYAPEIIMKTGYTKALDFWTLGVFLHEMVVFEPPFKMEDIKNKIRFKRVCKETEVSRNWKGRDPSSKLKNIINHLLKFDPKERLGSQRGWSQIKQHPFFEGFDWNLLKERKLASPLLEILENHPFEIKKKYHKSSSLNQEEDLGDIADAAEEDGWYFSRKSEAESESPNSDRF